MQQREGQAEVNDWPTTLREIFEKWHPYSDLAIAFLAIVMWEIIKFVAATFNTPRGRRKELRGKWQGSGIDIYAASGAAPLAFDVVMVFKLRSHDITGSAKLKTAAGISENLVLTGGFYNDRFLRLNYHNKKKDQLGVIFLEFGPNSDALAGTYSGYSPRRSTIVAGTVQLARPR